MAGLDELALALRAGQQGKADLAGMDEDYARATSDRDTMMTKADRYGQSSPLMAIGDLIKNSRGRQQMRELKPQRVNARNAIAENASALPLYQARKQQEAATQAQTNFETTENNKIGAATALRQAKQAAADLARTQSLSDTAAKDTRSDAVRDTGMYIGPNGAVRLIRGANDELLRDPSNPDVILPNQGDYTKAPTKASTTTFAGGGYDDKSANKRAEELIVESGKINETLGKVANFDAATTERLGSTQHRAIKVLEKALPSELRQFVASSMESNPEVKNYYAYLSGLSGAQRHRLFGSALTNVEKKSSDEFLAAVMALPLEEQVSRLRNVARDNKESLGVLDRVHGGDGASRYSDSYNAMGYNNLITPEAVVNEDESAGMAIMDQAQGENPYAGFSSKVIN
jgi:hypothetical protein